MKTQKTPEDYFLANRKFGPILLFFTMIATNFSAFTFLGFAGNAYKNGMGQYGIMAFGTGFMAITFYVIGKRVWELGREKGYLTPPELIGDIYQSMGLKILFMIIMVVFTIPYLATQAVGAGLLIETVTSGLINWQLAAVLTMLVIMLYLLTGGMRGSGWTDVIQGVIMITAMTLAVIFVAINLGGFENANLRAYQVNPALFSRPGPTGFFTPQIWFSFMILWLLADPMFPQLFSRFYTAKNPDSLKKTMILYPMAVSFLFLFPVLIGVWAHATSLTIPPGKEDMVLPLMVKNYTPHAVYSFVMIGALAALMSTADSQLFSLSTMLTRDTPWYKRLKTNSEILTGKILVFSLSIFAIIFVISGYDPSVGIMSTLVKSTFSGLAVLFPTVIAALYWEKSTKYGCISSIITGELSIMIYQHNLLPTYGFLPAIWSVLIATITLVIISLVTQPKTSPVK